MENIKERYEGLAKAGFDSKATYLAWVMDWKGYYREISNYIRETRAEIKETQRSLIFGPPLWRLQRGIARARHYATAALLLRTHSKKEAAYQVMIVMTHEESNDDAIRDARTGHTLRLPVEMAERLHQAAESGELEHVGVVGATTLIGK